MVAELPPFAARLEALRQAAEMTQLELAEATGLSVSLIAQLEQGRTGDPKLSTLQLLAAALKVDVRELVGDVATVKAPKKRRGGKDEP